MDPVKQSQEGREAISVDNGGIEWPLAAAPELNAPLIEARGCEDDHRPCQRQAENRCPLGEAAAEVIEKLFVDRNEDGKEHCLYRKELADLAAGLHRSPEQLVSGALADLIESGHLLRLDKSGRIANAAEMGRAFASIHHLIEENVDVHFVVDETRSKSPDIPLSESYLAELEQLTDAGEVAALMITKKPPYEAAIEIRDITDSRLAGLMCLWTHPRLQGSHELSRRLADYLKHATVRIICTGTDEKLTSIATDLNDHLERDGGFENIHWARVIKGISQDEKQESLKDAFRVCIPVIFLVKLTEKFLPGGLHIVGGVLDDVFGAILPSVSQSMGRKDIPFKERIKNAGSVLIGGAASIPLAFAFGAASSVIYSQFPSVAAHMAAGFLFALACCAGTLGTSVAAFIKARRAIRTLEGDENLGDEIRGMTAREKLAMAFRESIMDVPFRIGHTLIGVPFQIALGLVAGATGFFENGLFVMAEGMAETLFGAITAFAYPPIANAVHNRRLRRIAFHSDAADSSTLR